MKRSRIRRRPYDPNPGRADAIRQVRARAAGSCEANAAPECSGRHDHSHHRLLRSQGGRDTPENLLAVCSQCHWFIHENPATSYDRGWMLHGGPRVAP